VGAATADPRPSSKLARPTTDPVTCLRIPSADDRSSGSYAAAGQCQLGKKLASSMRALPGIWRTMISLCLACGDFRCGVPPYL